MRVQKKKGTQKPQEVMTSYKRSFLHMAVFLSAYVIGMIMISTNGLMPETCLEMPISC